MIEKPTLIFDFRILEVDMTLSNTYNFLNEYSTKYIPIIILIIV